MVWGLYSTVSDLNLRSFGVCGPLACERHLQPHQGACGAKNGGILYPLQMSLKLLERQCCVL